MLQLSPQVGLTVLSPDSPSSSSSFPRE